MNRVMKRFTLLAALLIVLSALAATAWADVVDDGSESTMKFISEAQLVVYVDGEWDGALSDSYGLGETVSLTAPEVSGKQFSHWTADGSIISYSNPLTLTVNAHTTLYAVYAAEAPAAVSATGFTSITRINDGTEISFQARADGTVTEAGIVYSTTVTGDDLIKGGTGVTTVTAVKLNGLPSVFPDSVLDSNNCWMLRIKPENDETVYHARTYMTSGGNTIYGDVKDVTLSELNSGYFLIVDPNSIDPNSFEEGSLEETLAELATKDDNGGNNSGGGGNGGYTPSSGSGNSSGTPSTSGTPTSETHTSETATAADGAAVTTELDTSSTTTKNSDGSVTVTDKATETVKTENKDGSAVETKTEKTNAETTGSKKNADGSVTDTTKISNTETVTQTATDAAGSKTITETKTEQEQNTAVTTKDNADGSKTEKTETTETVKVVEKVTDERGKVTESVTETTTETKTDMTTAADGTATGTSTTTTTVKDDKGNVLSTAVTEAEIKATTDANGMVTTETAATTTTTDAQGNETVEKTVTTENKAPDGSTGTVVKDESGSIVSQSTTISQKEAEAARDEGRPAQSPLTVTPVPEAVENSARSVQVNMPAVLYDKDGDGIVTVAEMPKVEIQVTYSGPGVVAKEKDASGNLTRITECYEGSVIVPVTGTGEIVIVDNTKTFNDVGATDWYSEYVTFVTAREIFNGTGNGNFAPNETMNRAMLAQVLYNFARGAKAGDGTAFADVSAGDWSSAAVGWAYENGIVNGYGGSFGAKNNITRQDMATILYRYAKDAGYDVSKSASLDRFSDAGSVADYASDAMRWAVGMDLINGTKDAEGNVTLNPRGSATRAQVAAIMTRFVRNAK